MAEAIAPWLARLERALRPRWPELLGPMAERLAGLLAILLGLLLSLPIPLTNIPLAVPLVLIGLGLAERDGVMLAIGLAVGRDRGHRRIGAEQRPDPRRARLDWRR